MKWMVVYGVFGVCLQKGNRVVDRVQNWNTTVLLSTLLIDVGSMGA
jgi:hypothetical protein